MEPLQARTADHWRQVQSTSPRRHRLVVSPLEEPVPTEPLGQGPAVDLEANPPATSNPAMADANARALALLRERTEPVQNDDSQAVLREMQAKHWEALKATPKKRSSNRLDPVTVAKSAIYGGRRVIKSASPVLRRAAEKAICFLRSAGARLVGTVMRAPRPRPAGRVEARPGFARSSAPTRGGPDDDPGEPKPAWPLRDDQAKRIAAQIVTVLGPRELDAHLFDSLLQDVIATVPAELADTARLQVFLELPDDVQGDYYGHLAAAEVQA